MNVRWDAVIDGGRCIEAEGVGSRLRPTQTKSSGPVPVKVWLYGALSGYGAERPVELELDGDFSVGAVIRELGRRLGEDFLRHVVDAAGKKFNHCLVFLDGVKVDINSPVHRSAASAQVELILLTATEGG